MSSSNAGQSAGQLETRGIEPVPEAECNGHPLQLFWVWFAANISILGLPLGATLVAFRGLAIWQAIIVAIIGAAGSFAVVGIISIAGRRGRAPSLTLSRAIFGVRGNIGPTLVSLMSRLGWETVNTTTAAFVLLSLCSILFGSPVEAKSAPILTLIFIAIFVLLTLSVSGLGHATLMQARTELLAAAEKSPVLMNVRESALAEAPQVQLVVDRKQANALGVSFADIGNVLSTAVGSSYINDFPNQGRMQRVVVQAEGDQRSQVADLLKMHVRNNTGHMVPLSAFVQANWIQGPAQLTRYNGYPAIAISGEPSPGHSTGEAMAEIERLVAQGPKGLGQEWTGLSLQERLSGNQAPILLGLSLLVVFLCLAALYESWSIPTSVLLVVPLGVLGAVLAVTLRGMPNDVFFKVGLITIIGLSAKNAILIIEFAKSLYDEGHDLIDATLQAARLRLRPIVMTSLAFILGVVPLAIATGASSASQQAIGTGVIGGMITATLAVIFVPVFFVVVMKLVQRFTKPH